MISVPQASVIYSRMRREQNNGIGRKIVEKLENDLARTIIHNRCLKGNRYNGLRNLLRCFGFVVHPTS